MTPQEIDRIERAIRHIESSLDVDQWASEIAVEAMRKQIPMKVRVTTSTKRCATCGRQLSGIGNIHPERNYCVKCGQAIDWKE